MMSINIKEYKCFKNFELDKISQINIITGGNNVGKTALLEAIFIGDKRYKTDDNYDIVLNSILQIAKSRDINESGLEMYLKKFIFASRLYDIRYKKISELNQREHKKTQIFNQYYSGYLINVNELPTLTPKIINLIPIKNIDYSGYKEYSNYINSSKPTNKRIIELYSNIQTRGIQAIFLKYLQILDKDIVWIEPQLIGDELSLMINLTNPEYSVISSELGEGTNRYIEILASLLSNSGGVVFIDEIENGIHHSKLKDIWKAIIEIVKKENIQLFVTTHDKDTIEALNKASEEEGFDAITSIELFKKDGIIHPIIMDYKNFSYGINMGEDIR